jgi:UDP-N-acetylglucosamine 4,6-dehydratase
MLENNVFITGGAGFLGRGILKRAHDEEWPCRFTVFSRDEVKHSRLKARYPAVRTIRGDVGTDTDFLTAAMLGHDIVIHAAATKVIPVAEHNPIQTFQDNIIGSLNVALAACQAGVKQVLGISTDKVCRPVNAYGISKKAMEHVFLEAQEWGYDTGFHLVRYGNVLDSTASVLTLWERQIKETGKLSITDPDMTRFWLSIDQAVDLVLLALEQIPGIVTVPLLPALRMWDMAHYVFPKANWDAIGVRPGEKKHEELITPEELPFVGDIILGAPEYVLLWPSTSRPLEKEKWLLQENYTSDKPLRLLTKEELLSMAGRE